MILFFTILLALAAAFAITAIIVNMANNSGDSKAEIKDISRTGYVMVVKYEAKSERIKLSKFR